MMTFSSLSETVRLSKPALLFVSGRHKDNQGRVHEFDDNRILTIAENTNRWYNQGGRIPFQEDHRKSQDANIGDLEGTVYTERITEYNLPDPKYKNLIGRLGIFTKNIVAKGSENVEKVKNQVIKTLSPGIDPITETIMEISATPFPAIVGPSLFSRDGESLNSLLMFENAIEDSEGLSVSNATSKKIKKVFSIEEALGKDETDKKIEEEYVKLSQALYRVLTSYHNSSEEELLGKDPIEGSYKALDKFVSELEDLFELIEDESSENEMENPGLSDESGVSAPVNQPPQNGGAVSGRPSKFSRFSRKPIGLQKYVLR